MIMDNSYILLLILKKGINVGDFVFWYYDFTQRQFSIPTFADYCVKSSSLAAKDLDEFEYKYFVSYLTLRNIL